MTPEPAVNEQTRNGRAGRPGKGVVGLEKAGDMALSSTKRLPYIILRIPGLNGVPLLFGKEVHTNLVRLRGAGSTTLHHCCDATSYQHEPFDCPWLRPLQIKEQKQ